jgi:exonuclease III
MGGRWHRTCGRIHIFQWKGKERIISAVERVEFLSDRMSYKILRDRWCHFFVLNVHAPTEDKTEDVKDSFYEALERVFDKFSKYHMKILLGDFNAKVGKEDIFKLIIGNESLHELVMIMDLG